ncbi:MAG: hypothetical protein AAF960_06860 [Bacteroidota bacterium]
MKAQTDAYGGWTTIKAPTTDFFSLAEINGRHTFVTPDGHAYYPLGTNHMSAYNNAKYRQIAAFQDDDLALKRLKEDITYFNMNAAGGDVPAIVKEHLPFFTTIHLTTNAHWLPASRFEFQDVFDASFIKQLKDNIRQKCLEHRDNRFLIGYYWTDTPRWDVVISRNRHLKDWVSHLRNLDGQAAGKKAYVDFLQQKYRTIEQFNRTYGLNFMDFEAVRNGRFDHIDFHQPYVIADDTEFLGVIAEHLYRITHETIKKYDSNHLILGEKYIAGDHPESVLRAAAKYVDVISIQPGPAKGPGPGYGKEESEFNVEGFNHLYRITDKPIMICDHTVSFYTKKYPVTLWHQFASQQLAGEAQSDYILQAAKTPYILGYMNCQYLDTYDSSRGLLKQGLLDKNGQRHQSYADLIKRANAAALGLVREQLAN